MTHRFLTKPCDAAELQSMIERVCTLQDLLSAPEIRRIVGTVGELPSLSRTHESLTQAVKDPSTTITQVADILGQDVAMSAKVLQLVNSAFFGLAQKVTKVQNAATYLGMETHQEFGPGFRRADNEFIPSEGRRNFQRASWPRRGNWSRNPVRRGGGAGRRNFHLENGAAWKSSTTRSVALSTHAAGRLQNSYGAGHSFQWSKNV